MENIERRGEECYPICVQSGKVRVGKIPQQGRARFPDKGQNKRIHRIIAPSLNVWGENGRLIPPVYAHTFRKAINNAEMWSQTAARTMRGIDCARAGILWRARSGWRRAG